MYLIETHLCFLLTHAIVSCVNFIFINIIIKFLSTTSKSYVFEILDLLSFTLSVVLFAKN